MSTEDEMQSDQTCFSKSSALMSLDCCCAIIDYVGLVMLSAGVGVLRQVCEVGLRATDEEDRSRSLGRVFFRRMEKLGLELTDASDVHMWRGKLRYSVKQDPL